MRNKIEILSPGDGCWKTRKIISKMRKFTDNENIDVDYVVISKLQDLLKFRTWILPTIIINGEIVARGYKPTNDVMINKLNK